MLQTLHLPKAGESLEGRTSIDWDDAFFLFPFLPPDSAHEKYA
jgi:hypothetical protein